MKKRIKLLALLLCLVLTVFAQKSNEQMGGIYYAYPEYKAAKYRYCLSKCVSIPSILFSFSIHFLFFLSSF